MKHTLLILTGIILVGSLYAQQDSIQKPTLWIRPYLENGITFINSDYLRKAYLTKTMYNWSLGIQIGNPNKNRILPFFQYSNSTFKAQRTNMIGQNLDSILWIQEFILGFNLAIKSTGTYLLKAKLAYLHSIVEDNLLSNSDKANGLQFGIGYEVRLLKRLRVYIDYSYDFMKLAHGEFQDYDIQKITFGFIL